LVWKLDQSLLNDGGSKAKQGLPNKRQKTGPINISPSGKIHCSGGLSSLKWIGPNRIVAGCFDHSLKLINAERQQVEEILFTSHKVATCLDSSKESILLTGHEDATLRLWDIRSG